MGCWSLDNIVIPETVTTLGDSCFASCKNLKEINIPDSVTEIGDGVFQNCFNLKQIAIPDTITEISFNLFSFFWIGGYYILRKCAVCELFFGLV